VIEVARQIRVVTGCRPEDVPVAELLRAGEPVVLKGVALHWGLVQAGLRSEQEAMSYLRSFYNGRILSACFGEPEIAGRLFYNEDFTQLNFESRRAPMDEVLRDIEQHLQDDRPPTRYIASTTIDACLPGFRNHNDASLAARFVADGFEPLASIWIGNRTTASCHYDAPNNLACVAVGRRRFTVFPPEQIFNLYPGPLEPTPGGQAVSLVDFANPDYERYPRFREALAAAQAAELEPGDAVFIPSMWWHHVEALSRFNTLVNYWWSTSSKFVPTPMNALYHALWSLRDRPESEKRAWRDVFEYYVFGSSQRAGEHLPEEARGVLGPMDDTKARQIRAMLMNNLNR
jgi:hypothetical protein